jgi:hypothetical protein
MFALLLTYAPIAKPIALMLVPGLIAWLVWIIRTDSLAP